MLAVPRCGCRCHRVAYLSTVAPDVREVLEAAVACPVCINLHCPAIIANWPWPYEPRPKPLAAADGYPYEPTEDPG